MTRASVLALGIALAAAACTSGGDADPAGGDGSSEAADGEAATESETDPTEAACHRAVEANSEAIVSLLDRASTVYPDAADGVISFIDLQRRPMPDEARAALFAALPEVEALLQSKVSVTPQDEFASFVFMRNTNSSSRSARRFSVTVGEHTTEARAGQHIDSETEVATTACWFDIDVERDGGGTYGIGVTFAIEP